MMVALSGTEFAHENSLPERASQIADDESYCCEREANARFLMRDGEVVASKVQADNEHKHGEGNHAGLTTAIAVDEDAEPALIPLHDEICPCENHGICDEAH